MSLTPPTPDANQWVIFSDPPQDSLSLNTPKPGLPTSIKGIYYPNATVPNNHSYLCAGSKLRACTQRLLIHPRPHREGRTMPILQTPKLELRKVRAA